MSEERLSRISATLRFYGEMRFKQLTVFLAWLTLAGAGVVHFGAQEFVGSQSLRAILALATMFVTGVVWVMEVRSTMYWVTIRSEAPEVWPHTKKAFLPAINATNAVFFLYLVNYGFWCWCAFKWNVNFWIFVVFALIGFVIFLFTIVNYWRCWKLSADKERGTKGVRMIKQKRRTK